MSSNVPVVMNRQIKCNSLQSYVPRNSYSTINNQKLSVNNYFGMTNIQCPHNEANGNRQSLLSNSDSNISKMSDKHTVLITEEGTSPNEGLQEHQRQIRVISLYILVTVIALLCIALIIGFIVIPVIFAHSVFIQRLAMFTNIGLPSNREDFEKLDKFPNVLFRNFYINFADGSDQTISLGVWHFLPYEMYPNATIIAPSEVDYDQALRNNTADVVIYFHGSGECRKDPLLMYDRLMNLFHVVAFDYRDYADSTPATLSERSVAEDAVHVFRWVRGLTSRRIYVWGHSLGTPLSTLTINILPENLLPHGLILESPMTSMIDEIGQHPYGKVFAWLPWFEQTITNPLKRNGFLFETDRYILNVSCPILILHAEDDSIIPYTLGQKLARIAAQDRPRDAGNVTYVQFSKKYRFDHFRIYRSKQLVSIIGNFTVICDEYYNKTHKIPRTLPTTTLYTLK